MKQNPSLSAFTSQTPLSPLSSEGQSAHVNVTGSAEVLSETEAPVTKQRSPADSVNEAPIVLHGDVITQAQIDAFARATHSVHHQFVPATFPTLLRASEFQWLDRLEVDLRELLHTEQEYEYLEPLKAGDRPVVSTGVIEYRERRGLLFVSLRSEIRCGDRIAVVACSSFVVRKGQGRNP